jgi:terminase large subunit-like protein
LTTPYQYHRKTLSSKSQVINLNDLSVLEDLPFWIWDQVKHRARYIETNGLCCFQHAIGLPEKDGRPMPLFDYEKILYDSLKESKYLFCVKATGLGITEFILRYIAWLCTRDTRLRRSQICIVTGPRIDLAITLIDRLKALFLNLGIVFSNKETVLELNGVRIEAFPSHHLDAMRGLANVSFVYLDEADFFPRGQQQDARKVSERYIAKSDPYIVFVSTPNNPGGLFESMEKENVSIYNRIKLDYTYGLGKIYSEEEIQEQKRSPSFKQEYCCQYLGTIGNLFSPKQIDEIVKLGQQYKDIAISQYTLKTIGIDPGFSSSATAIVMCEHIRDKEDKIIVRHSELIDKGDPNEIADLLWDFHLRYPMNLYYLIDGSNRAMVNLLKIKFNEPLNWDSKTAGPNNMTVIPVNFATEHKQMLSHLHVMITDKYLVIPEEHDKLIISLRTAYANDLSLDKQQTSYSDSLDALRLSLKGYKIE